MSWMFVFTWVRPELHQTPRLPCYYNDGKEFLPPSFVCFYAFSPAHLHCDWPACRLASHEGHSEWPKLLLSGNDRHLQFTTAGGWLFEFPVRFLHSYVIRLHWKGLFWSTAFLLCLMHTKVWEQHLGLQKAGTQYWPCLGHFEIPLSSNDTCVCTQ